LEVVFCHLRGIMGGISNHSLYFSRILIFINLANNFIDSTCLISCKVDRVFILVTNFLVLLTKLY